MRAKRICLFYLGYMCLTLFAACTKEGFFRPSDTDPRSIFEETWTVLSERYALFPDKGVNWDSVRNLYQSRFTSEMTEQALFAELSRMLETLRDGHLTLIAPFDTASYNGFYAGYPRNFSLEHIRRNYLSANPGQQGPLLYDIRERVGYVYYGQFTSRLELADLRTVIEAMRGTKGLIIDVRNNTGGFIQSAQRLAAALTREPLLVKYEQYKSGAGRQQFTNPLAQSVVPEGVYYPEKVIVLTNRSCFSACNDFVLYTKSMVQVRRYGDQTGGGGSIPSSYQLANGWFLQYSSSRTLNPSLQSVEMGIPPHRNIEITVLDDLRGVDPILEAAFLDLR